MPRSANRRTIEVPVQLYEELKARAAQEGTTIPAVLQALITDGKSVEEWYGEMVGMLHEVRRDVRALREAQETQNVTQHAVALAGSAGQAQQPKTQARSQRKRHP